MIEAVREMSSQSSGQTRKFLKDKKTNANIHQNTKLAILSKSLQRKERFPMMVTKRHLRKKIVNTTRRWLRTLATYPVETESNKSKPQPDLAGKRRKNLKLERSGMLSSRLRLKNCK